MSSGSALPHQLTADVAKINIDTSSASGQSRGTQSDISKMKLEADGSFKRKASTFRDSISLDGEFTPDKGTGFFCGLQLLC